MATTPLISDEELTALGAPPGSLPAIDNTTRSIHIRAASALFRGLVGAKYFVTASWVTEDEQVKLCVARLATYSLYFRRGFDPEVDKQVANGEKLARDFITEITAGRYAIGLSARRVAHIGAQTEDPNGDGWFNWRRNYCVGRRGWGE